jgi:hypothetical protein
MGKTPPEPEGWTPIAERLAALHEEFRTVHRAGLEALNAGYYAAAEKAIRREGEIISACGVLTKKLLAARPKEQ